MTEQTNPNPDEGNLPQAVARHRKRWLPSIVWLIPLVAVIVGGWLAARSVLNQGPTITINFHSADGLQAGQTRIKFREVDVGVIRQINISPDKPGVTVTAELNKQVEPMLVNDTKFWVVKPRIAASGVSGLNTLLSGAYIGMEAGKSQQAQRDFTGLEVPPVLTEGLPGRTFVLKADDLGSVDYGTPVYYRRVAVGEVVAYSLDQNGQGLSIEIFVRAPYDKFVTNSTRFWEASGIDFSVDANGIQMNTQSLASLLLGGIAFAPIDERDSNGSGTEAQAMAAFHLYDDRTSALRLNDSRVEYYEMLFLESVHGLAIGSPVEFRGIPIGEVVNIGLDYDRTSKRINIPVEVRLYPDRLTSRLRHRLGGTEQQQEHELIAMVNAGLRGQLRTGSLITGQLYIALDFFPNATKVHVEPGSRQIPTMKGDLQELQSSLTSIAAKLDKVPFGDLANDLRKAITSLDTALQSANKVLTSIDGEVLPAVRQTVTDAQRTMQGANHVLAQDSPTQTELRETLREVSRAATSLRTLVDYLDRHPEALIRGRQPEDTK